MKQRLQRLLENFANQKTGDLAFNPFFGIRLIIICNLGKTISKQQLSVCLHAFKVNINLKYDAKPGDKTQTTFIFFSIAH